MPTDKNAARRKPAKGPQVYIVCGIYQDNYELDDVWEVKAFLLKRKATSFMNQMEKKLEKIRKRDTSRKNSTYPDDKTREALEELDVRLSRSYWYDVTYFVKEVPLSTE